MFLDIQALVDSISAAGEHARSKYHLTLGELFEKLSKSDGAKTVEFSFGGSPGQPNSYRGYYSDLAFAPSSKPITVKEFLDVVKICRGKTFYGWKGGDFTMHDKTPLWVSEAGECSNYAITDYIDGDKVILSVMVVED